jgi:hypothetical protein
MPVTAINQGEPVDAFGTAFPPSSPTFQTVTGAGTIYALNALPAGSSITWEKRLGATKPNAMTMTLEGCNSDPSVAANWQVLDSTTDVTIVAEERVLANPLPVWIRLNITAITTPGTGGAGVIHVR